MPKIARSPKLIWAIRLGTGGLLLLAAGLIWWFAARRSSSPPDSPEILSVNPTGVSYKDGTYDASVSYHSPRGENTINVSVTLAKGIVMDVGVDYERWMPSPERFIASAKPVLVGKSIDGLAIGAVSGASLTTTAFNTALEQVRVEAEL